MPAHRRLDRLVQVAKRHRAGHDQPAPDRRLGAAQRHLQSDDVLAGFGLGCAGHDLPSLSASDIGEDVSTALLCGMPLPGPTAHQPNWLRARLTHGWPVHRASLRKQRHRRGTEVGHIRLCCADRHRLEPSRSFSVLFADACWISACRKAVRSPAWMHSNTNSRPDRGHVGQWRLQQAEPMRGAWAALIDPSSRRTSRGGHHGQHIQHRLRPDERDHRVRLGCHGRNGRTHRLQKGRGDRRLQPPG